MVYQHVITLNIPVTKDIIIDSMRSRPLSVLDTQANQNTIAMPTNDAIRLKHANTLEAIKNPEKKRKIERRINFKNKIS